MGLPFKPETMEQLQQRYQAAMKKLFHTKDFATDRPGMLRTHVFDFEDGMRLIIGRERHKGPEYLHFSISVEHCSGGIMEEFYKKAIVNKSVSKFGVGAKKKDKDDIRDEIIDWLTGAVKDRFRELSGDVREAKYMGISHDGVLHFTIGDMGDF